MPRLDESRHGEDTQALRHNLDLENTSFSRDDIQDIAGTTELQADPAGRPHIYWLLEIGGMLDVRTLNCAIAIWTQKYSILRTAFLSHQGQLIQIILSELKPILVHKISEQDPMEIAMAWSQEDSSKTQTLLGTPPLSIALVQKHPSRSVLVVRISHAQYDGICLQRILESLLELYQGKEISAINIASKCIICVTGYANRLPAHSTFRTRQS